MICNVIADAVEMELTYSFKEAVKVINSFYLNRSVNEFLEQEYDAPLDFYTAATEISERNFYEVGTGVSGIVLCADNDTILEGRILLFVQYILDDRRI